MTLVDGLRTKNSLAVIVMLLAGWMPGQVQASAASVTSQLQQVEALVSKGETDQAIERYQQLIKQYPSQPALYNNLAILLSRKGDYEAARDMLDKGLKTSKTYSVLHENLSTVYMEMARNSYGKALQLDSEIKPATLTRLDMAAEPDVDRPPVEVAMQQPLKPPPPAVIKKPEPPKPVVAKPVASKPVVEANPARQQVMESLNNWAAAWSAQSAEQYLAYYHDQFSPYGIKRETWQQQRKQRISAPGWIKVELQDMQVNMQSADQASVTLLQVYRSDTYQDKTRKQFVMKNTADGWRISRERSLGVIE